MHEETLYFICGFLYKEACFTALEDYDLDPLLSSSDSELRAFWGVSEFMFYLTFFSPAISL